MDDLHIVGKNYIKCAHKRIICGGGLQSLRYRQPIIANLIPGAGV